MLLICINSNNYHFQMDYNWGWNRLSFYIAKLPLGSLLLLYTVLILKLFPDYSFAFNLNARINPAFNQSIKNISQRILV